MPSLPTLLSVAVFLLCSGDVHLASHGDCDGGVGAGSVSHSTHPRLALIRSPTPLPLKPDDLIFNQGESEIEEEDTDEFGKFLIAPAFCFHLHPFLRGQPSAFSGVSRAWVDADRVDSVMRC